jgi:hypothetical protein
MDDGNAMIGWGVASHYLLHFTRARGYRGVNSNRRFRWHHIQYAAQGTRTEQGWHVECCFVVCMSNIFIRDVLLLVVVCSLYVVI